MAVLASEIQIRLSGGSANTNPLTSLGGVKSSTVIGTDLFDTVDGAESSAGDIEYRCVYVHNANASETALGVSVFFVSNTTSPSTELFVGSGSAAVNATEQTVANENTAPSSVTFASPSSEGSAVLLGDIPAGQHKSVWFRRNVTAGAGSLANDTASIQFVWQS